MKLFSWSLVLILLFFATVQLGRITSSFKIPDTIVEINRGDSAAQIAAKLYRKKVISSPLAFRILVKITGDDKKLSHGQYLFNGNLNLMEVIRKMREGKFLVKKITIPEGSSMFEVAQICEKRRLGSYERYLQLASDTLFVKKLTGKAYPSLEGFLYPNTYNIPAHASEEYVLRVMVKEFYKETATIDYTTSALDFYDIVKLASIVEEEVVHAREKPIVASVYTNRIRKKQRLQADPTISYVLLQKGVRRNRLKYGDLKIDSPFNTYLYDGLPPTPICSPVVSTLKAVLTPEVTPYYYFFADSSESHIFTATYAEHLQKQREMRLNNGNK